MLASVTTPRQGLDPSRGIRQQGGGFIYKTCMLIRTRMI